MSGGVDSAVAVKLLLDAGHEVEGVTFTVEASDEAEAALRDARLCAEAYGIPHRALDLSAEFDCAVKADFVREYERGRTPNPCVVCNRHIKFGYLVRYAEENGFDFVATGHYAKISREGGRVRLERGADTSKDQSYMLAHVPEENLKKAILPLGEYTKEEIRGIAASLGLVSANKKDSQDICFIPDGDYVGFLTRYRGRAPVEGDYVDENGNILGRHRGQECCTIGQSRGLGIALGRRVFVLDKNAERNTVTLGDPDALMKSEVILENVNYIGVDGIRDGEAFQVKIRYAHRAADARLYNVGGGLVRAAFDTPQRAPSPGQLAVIYDGERVIGGGVIV